MSASVGCGLVPSNAAAAMICPGWQNPHCATSSSIHACCTGWSVPPPARPSIVVTARPAQSATGVMHGLNAPPSRWLVHALHTPTPQPYFGPVTPSRSRRTHSNGSSAAAVTVVLAPFSVNVKLGIAGSSTGDREAGGCRAGGAGVGVGHRRRRRREAELAGSTRLAGGRHHHHADLGRAVG